jgi:hypothetical protein
MDRDASPKADETPQTSREDPFTTFIQLDGQSPVPSQFRTPGTFTITKMRSEDEAFTRTFHELVGQSGKMASTHENRFPSVMS